MSVSSSSSELMIESIVPFEGASYSFAKKQVANGVVYQLFGMEAQEETFFVGIREEGKEEFCCALDTVSIKDAICTLGYLHLKPNNDLTCIMLNEIRGNIFYNQQLSFALTRTVLQK